VLGFVWLVAGQTVARAQVVEDVRVSRSGDEAVIEIDLACPMRFVSDLATQGGVLLEIRVSPLDACLQGSAGSGLSSEKLRPVGGHLAHLFEIEYESLGLGENILFLRFDQPVTYTIEQRGRLRTLVLTVTAEGAPPPTPSVSSRPPIEAPEAPAPALEREAPAASGLTRMRVREPVTTSDYIINLQSTREYPDPATADSIAVPDGRQLYVSRTLIDGQGWHRLRIGFFGSEAEASAALEPLRANFPRAWIGRAEPEEVANAADFSFREGGMVDAAALQRQPVAAATVPEVSAQGTMSADEIAERMAEGREAILAENYDEAVRLYTSVLSEPGEHRAEAREFLGVARERSGQLAHARAEYAAYLDEFPDAEGTLRVRQRLNGLVTANEAPRDRLRSQQSEDVSPWSFNSGISQYYRQDINRFDDESDDVTTLSALMTDVDFGMQRSGERVDLRARIALSHFHDLLDASGGGREDQERYSYAYLEMSAAEGPWSVAMGRQSLHNWGVLGRFDGAHFAYDLGTNRRLHVVTGYPVDSTRDTVETDRQFNGIAVDFDNLVGSWDLSVFANTQTIEGIDDRNGVGLEARYIDDRRSVTAMLDYDLIYGELNTGLLLGTWRLKNRMTLSGLLDVRTSPFLTTRNALIGQPVATIEELLLVWTVDEIEQLARDRTSQSTTATMGLSTPLGERFQINADVTITELEPTVESAGVPAMPGTGVQTYYSASLVGSGLVGSRDVNVLNLRQGSSDLFDTSQITWDGRFAVGQRIRINPRVRYSVWEGLADGRKRYILGGSLRALVNLRNRYRLELEVGSNRMLRTSDSGRSESTGEFFNLGYRANF